MSVKKSVFCQNFMFLDIPPYLHIALSFAATIRPAPADVADFLPDENFFSLSDP